MTITDIVNKIYFYTKTNSSTYTAADMLLAINTAYDRVVSLIMDTDGRWEWDDNNNTDFPIATATLTADQQDYALSVTHLNLLRIEVKDESGNWKRLLPFSQSDIKGSESLTDFYKTSGAPIYYDVLGSSVFLYPPPDYTQAASLKIYFKRGGANYTSAEVTTGTKVPGFNSLYHDLIPLWASYDYATANNQKNANRLLANIQMKEDALEADYSQRNLDEPLKMTVSHNSPR